MKFKEFWIYEGSMKKGEYDLVSAEPLIGFDSIHVIEYSAIEAKDAEIERLKEVISTTYKFKLIK